MSTAYLSVYRDECCLLTDIREDHPDRCEHGVERILPPELITPRPELGRGWNVDKEKR